MSTDVSPREKARALYRVGAYRPKLTLGVIGLSLVSAVLEGIGLTFLLPILRTARGSTGGSDNALVDLFASVYDFVGIPFTLEFIILGVGIVMVVRYVSAFLVAWFKAKLQTEYVRDLQIQLFRGALNARIAYFDAQGSDDILNTIVTETRYSRQVIQNAVKIIEVGLVSVMYLSIAVALAPVFSIISGLLLGGLMYGLRTIVESGYAVGDRVASANERVQEAVQAGTQGIRDVKLFGMSSELFGDFLDAVNEYSTSSITLRRNQAGLDNFYELATALTVFALIYGALEFSSLSLAGLGVFLFAMFRLAPRVSTLNDTLYSLEGNLPHLVRTQGFITEIERESEPTGGETPVPEPVEEVRFENVSFAYESTQKVLSDVSFTVGREEFVAFVGSSGAGKSTIVSLLTRMYEPNSGTIAANGVPISEFPVDDWRAKISVVRQDPFIFNDTLRYNVTVGKRDVSENELERVCEIADVTEFLDDLPNGYDTILGDDGVKLSGGQRQRVSIARALLKDADLLVLDEATSDLDSNIEERVHSAIEAMDRDYAMIVIAHRLSTVLNADRIYTMADGRIEEVGTHGDLIDNGGTYADLYTTQTRTH